MKRSEPRKPIRPLSLRELAQVTAADGTSVPPPVETDATGKRSH